MSDCKAKMNQIQLRLGLRPRPGGAYSAPSDPLAGVRGPTSKERGGDGKERGGDETRPLHAPPPLIHISGYAPAFLSVCRLRLPKPDIYDECDIT